MPVKTRDIYIPDLHIDTRGGRQQRKLLPPRRARRRRSPVRPDQAPKSVGAERTFDRDLTAEADLLDSLSPVIDAAWQRIERAGSAGRTPTLKVKFAEFSVISRAATRTLPIAARDEVAETGAALLRRMLPVGQGIHLLGLTLAGFEPSLPVGEHSRAIAPAGLIAAANEQRHFRACQGRV